MRFDRLCMDGIHHTWDIARHCECSIVQCCQYRVPHVRHDAMPLLNLNAC